MRTNFHSGRGGVIGCRHVCVARWGLAIALLVALPCFSGLVPASPAFTFPAGPTEVDKPEYEASVELHLDKEVWSDSEPITGTVMFWLLPKENVPEGKETVWLKGPNLQIAFLGMDRENPSATLTEVRFDGRVDNPVRLGQRYAVPFVIRLDQSFKGVLDQPVRPFPMFAAGSWRMRAVVSSPFAWGHQPRWVELYGLFRSEWVNLQVKATDGPPLTRQEILAAVKRAEGETKLAIIKYYATEKVLAAFDLVLLMLDAKPVLRGHLAEIYSSSGHPLAELLFFERAPREVLLCQDMMPFFLLIAPGKQITFASTEDVEFSFHAFKDVHRIEAHGEVSVAVPETEGVYKVAGYNPYNRRSTSGRAWGWILVFDGEMEGR